MARALSCVYARPMADVLLFHHALGLTAGMRAFADELRSAGHAVTTPDLYGGDTFDSITDGVANAQRIGFDAVIERGVACADGLGDGLVVAGFSLGVLPAQKLAQTRPGVAGAVLYHSAVPPEMFGDGWPDGVALQMHIADGDEWAAEDMEAVNVLSSAHGGPGELFMYETSGHLIADSSFGEYDADLAGMIIERTLAFLAAHD